VVPLNASDRRWDQLATTKGRTTESPSLISKMRSGGELWLSGIPTEATKGYFPRVDLQVSCCMRALKSAVASPWREPT
jgi:hypothetical protein